MFFLRALFFKAIHMSNWTLLFATLFLISFSSFFVHYIEPQTFISPFEGLWWTMTTIVTVGYGDVSPVTVKGKIFAMFLFVFGIGLMTVLIGKVIDLLGYRKRMKEEGQLAIKAENHIILINWTERARIALKELLDTFSSIHIVILDEVSDRVPFLHPRVDFVKGPPAAEETLRQANFLKAKSIMIFSPDHAATASAADGLTLLIASGLEAAAKKADKDIYTICEVADSANINAFAHANVEEFITPNDMAARLAARSVFFNGSSEIIRQLICNEGYDLYQIPAQKSWRTYGDAKLNLEKQGIILVADHHDFSILSKLNEPLPSGARLFVIGNSGNYKNIK